MSRVLKADIFSFQFDYDEWPSNHTDDKTYYRAYNGSIFNLRNSYREVFHEDEFEDISNRETQVQSDKVYKIKYNLNTLAGMSECVSTCPITGDKIYKNKDYSIL